MMGNRIFDEITVLSLLYYILSQKTPRRLARSFLLCYNCSGAIYSVGGQSEPLKGGEADGTIRLFGVSIHGDDLRRCVEGIGKPA